MNKKYGIMAGSIIVSLVVIYLVASQLVPRVLVSMTKAAPATKVSLSESYLLGERILCKADGKDACRVNIFVLDENGRGVMGKQVVLNGKVTITPKSAMSDAEGKVSFGLVSGQESQDRVTATIEGVPMGKSVTVTFRNEN